MVELLIQLDELKDSFLKKAISFLRQRLETAEKNSVQVIDVVSIEDEQMEKNLAVDSPDEEPIDVVDAHALPNTTIESVDSQRHH